MVLKFERLCQLILEENMGNMYENRFFWRFYVQERKIQFEMGCSLLLWEHLIRGSGSLF